MTDSVSTHAAGPPPDASMGELVAKVSEQTSRLLRDELRLAQLEMTEKGKKVGFGAGLFGGAGLLAVFGLGCLVATAILALAGPLSGWLAALLVGLALFVVAGGAALMGKREVKQGTPAIPAEAVEGVKQDVQTLKPGRSS
jgi:uncharacterized membrane protein YqjE